MIQKIVDLFGPPLLSEIGWRSANHPPVRRNFPDDTITVFQMGIPDSQIKAFSQDIHQTICQMQIDLNF